MMNNAEKEALKLQDKAMSMLLHRALHEKPTEFRLLVHKAELANLKKVRFGCKVAVKLFQNLVEGALESYIADVVEGKEDITVLLTCKEFNKCKEFYENECRTIDDMISEYRCYRRWGHFLSSCLGGVRAEKDMVDYRTIPISF